MKAGPLDFGARMSKIRADSKLNSQRSYEKRIMRDFKRTYGFDYGRLLELYGREDVAEPLDEFKEEIVGDVPEIKNVFPKWYKKRTLEGLLLKPTTNPAFQGLFTLLSERRVDVAALVFPVLKHGDWVLHNMGPGEPLKGVFLIEMFSDEGSLWLEPLKNYLKKRSD